MGSTKGMTTTLGIIGFLIIISFCLFKETSFVIFSLLVVAHFLLGLKEPVVFDEFKALNLVKLASIFSGLVPYIWKNK